MKTAKCKSRRATQAIAHFLTHQDACCRTCILVAEAITEVYVKTELLTAKVEAKLAVTKVT